MKNSLRSSAFKVLKSTNLSPSGQQEYLIDQIKQTRQFEIQQGSRIKKDILQNYPKQCSIKLFCNNQWQKKLDQQRAHMLMKNKNDTFYCEEIATSLDKKDPIKNQSLYENLTLMDAKSTKMAESRARTIETSMQNRKLRKSEV